MKIAHFLRHLLSVSMLFGTLTACTAVEIKETNFFIPRQIMSSGERFEVRSHDGILLVGRLLRSARPSGTIVFFNGNADLALLSGKRLSKLAEFGFNVVAVDYRGFGESGGTLTLNHLQSDSLAIYQAVANRDDLGTKRFNIDPGLATADNPAELKKYAGPLLIISGRQDIIAPPAFSERLYSASVSSTKRWINVDANHKNIYDEPEFALAFEAFSTLVFGKRQH